MRKRKGKSFADQRLVASHAGFADHRQQLVNIAGPIVFRESVPNVVAETVELSGLAPIRLLQQMLGEKSQILLAGPQRRNGDAQLGDQVEKVGPQTLIRLENRQREGR